MCKFLPCGTHPVIRSRPVVRSPSPLFLSLTHSLTNNNRLMRVEGRGCPNKLKREILRVGNWPTVLDQLIRNRKLSLENGDEEENLDIQYARALGRVLHAHLLQQDDDQMQQEKRVDLKSEKVTCTSICDKSGGLIKRDSLLSIYYTISKRIY